jgi:hypothetical protein
VRSERLIGLNSRGRIVRCGTRDVIEQVPWDCINHIKEFGLSRQREILMGLTNGRDYIRDCND